MNKSFRAMMLSCIAFAPCAVSLSARAETSADAILARIEALEKKNAQLENENSALRGRVNRIEASKAAKADRAPLLPTYKTPPVVPARADVYDSAPGPVLGSRFETSAAFLYLQPGGGNLQYGTLVTPLPLPSPNWANQSLNPGFSPAFRVGLGYRVTESEDVQANWTHLNAGAHDSFAGGPTQMAGPPFLIGPGANAYKMGQGDVNFAYDSITADGGHTFCAACAFQWRVFGGLELARIGQNLSGAFESYDGSNTSGYTNSSLFTGLGPRLGTKAQYDLGAFHFVGEVAAAALVGRSQSHIDFTTTSAGAGAGIPQPNNQTLTSPNAMQLVPAIETSVAVSYALPPTSYGQLKLELGYQAAVYANAISQYSLTQVATPPVVGTVGVFLATQQHLLSDFTVQGPYAAARFLF